MPCPEVISRTGGGRISLREGVKASAVPRGALEKGMRQVEDPPERTAQPETPRPRKALASALALTPECVERQPLAESPVDVDCVVLPRVTAPLSSPLSSPPRAAEANGMARRSQEPLDATSPLPFWCFVYRTFIQCDVALGLG